MQNSIDIRIDIIDKQLLKTVYSAIVVETNAKEIERGKFQIRIDESSLIIKVKGADFVATRALTNSIMRLVKMSIDVGTTIEI